MKFKPFTISLIMLGLSACSAQTINDLIPAHQLSMLQVESYVKPEGGFLLKPELAEITHHAITIPSAPVSTASPEWSTPTHKAPESLTPNPEAISVSAMLQQALDYAQGEKRSAK